MSTTSPLLNTAIKSILKRIPTGDQLDIMEMTEDQFTVGSHFSMGVNIRNDLGIWKENSLLRAWFTSNGVVDPDDMVEIILACVYRVIMAKDIDLDGQFAKFQERE